MKIRIAHRDQILILHVEGGPVLPSHVGVFQAGVMNRVKQGTRKGVIDLTQVVSTPKEVLASIARIRVPAALLGGFLAVACLEPGVGDAADVDGCLARLGDSGHHQKLLAQALQERSKEIEAQTEAAKARLADIEKQAAEVAGQLKENAALRPLVDSLEAMLQDHKLRPEGTDAQSPAYLELLDTMDVLLAREGLEPPKGGGK